MERHGAEGEYRSEAGSKGEGKGALCATCRPALAAAPAACRQRQAEEAAPGMVGDELGENIATEVLAGVGRRAQRAALGMCCMD